MALQKWGRTSVQEYDCQLRLDSYKTFSTLFTFFSMYDYTPYRAYYAGDLKNIEELHPGNKEILPVSINQDAKTSGGITNFSTKHQCKNGLWTGIQ